MVALKPIINKNRKHLLLIGIIVFAFFPLFSEKTKGVPVILFTIISTVLFYFAERKKIDLKFFLINSSLFIINLFSIFYSFSLVFPLKKIETSLSLIVIPFAFSIINNDNYKSLRKLFINTFILASSLLSIILLIYYFHLGLFNEGILKVNSFRKAATSIAFLQDHPIYISMYFGLSVLFLTNIFAKINAISNKLRALYLFCFGVLFVGLILLSSKGVLITIVISVSYYLWVILKGRIKYYIISMILISFISLIIFSPTVERRFRELTINTTYTKFHTSNSSSLRYAIYKCVLEKVNKSPLTGYGWGESKKSLNDCYKGKWQYLYNGNYNSHNQFLGYTLNGGIIGLIILLLFISNAYINSLKNKDFLFSSVILFFSLIMMFENILERQSGLILFIFTICLFKFLKENKI